MNIDASVPNTGTRNAGAVVLGSATVLAFCLWLVQVKLGVVSQFDYLAVPVLAAVLGGSFLWLATSVKNVAPQAFKVAYFFASCYFQASWFNVFWIIEGPNLGYSLLILACSYPLMYGSSYFVTTKHYFRLAAINYGVFSVNFLTALLYAKNVSPLEVQVGMALVLTGPIHGLFLAYIQAQKTKTENLLKTKIDLQQKIYKDPLTQAYTRDYFALNFKDFEKSSGLAICMVDADHFKSINDTYGHFSGDQVLKEIADCLKNTLGASAEVFRWGGEEFLIVIKDVKSASVLTKMCQDLNASVKKATTEKTSICCSVSIGVCMTHASEISLENAIRRADQAVYQAKAQGRDQFVIK